MKDLVIFWIVAQLILIGWGVADLYNQTLDGTFECLDKSQKITPYKAATLPLAFFLPNWVPDYFDEYCKSIK